MRQGATALARGELLEIHPLHYLDYFQEQAERLPVRGVLRHPFAPSIRPLELDLQGHAGFHQGHQMTDGRQDLASFRSRRWGEQGWHEDWRHRRLRLPAEQVE
jgi:hypothetical protein